MYHLHDIKTFLHLSKHGVLAVKVGRAANCGVNLYLLVGKADIADTLVGFSSQSLLQRLKSGAVTVPAHLHDFRTVLGGKGIEGFLNALHPQLLGELSQLPLTIDLSPDDVELRPAAPSLGVHLVALPGSSQRTALMQQVVLDFRLNGVIGTTRPQHLAGRSTLGVGVATLNHKVLDDPVEQRPVIIALLCQFQEIVPMQRGLVV